MTTTYRYAVQCKPPAPFVAVSLSTSDGTVVVRDLPAQIDTAADRTIVPSAVIETLQLSPSRQSPFEGLGGALTRLSLFELLIAVQPLAFGSVEVAARPDEQYVLLGRDVLNQYRIVLDGPRSMLEIGQSRQR
ncbi:MAG: hypothetical protein ACJ8F7_08935 [Gemmataceae bacterium]